MKRIFLIFALLPVTILGQNNSKELAKVQYSRTVYLCMGPMSKAYHLNPNCRGLDRCSTEIKEVSESQAISMGRHLCGYEK